MDSEHQTGLILSEVQTWVAELERAVQHFEGTVTHAEECMNEVTLLESAPDTHAESGLQLLFTHALQSSQAASARVSAANAALNEALAQAELAVQHIDEVDDLTPLPEGALVCGGRYRVLRLLHQRPRVHLYLARRQVDVPIASTGEYPLVVIRELVLSDLEPELRQCIERAAFEEFAAPNLFGTPHLPGVGDRVCLEFGRHYLVMQPRQARGSNWSHAALLSEILPGQLRGSAWPHMTTALRWCTRLCQTVAHLHQMQNVLGELTPEMVLVDRDGYGDWSPTLLACWPPAPPFWPGPGQGEEYHLVFPTRQEGQPDAYDEQAFAAPEISEGLRDERSDVYALGAILYLMLTGCIPSSAAQRLQAEGASKSSSRRSHKRQSALSGRALTPPHLLNERISPLQEKILLRALALNPEQRFANAQDLADALEGIHLTREAFKPGALPQANVSRLRKLLEWIRK